MGNFDFIEEEKRFYLREAGFTERERAFFLLRLDGKTLWEISEEMGYSSRTIDRINKSVKNKIRRTASYYNMSY